MQLISAPPGPSPLRPLSSCLQSAVLFSTLQQAQAAHDGLVQRARSQGFQPATSLVSIPLHQPLLVQQPLSLPGAQYAAVPPQAQPAAPRPQAPQAAAAAALAQQGPSGRPSLPPNAAQPAPVPAPAQQLHHLQHQHQQHQQQMMPSSQQQREAVTMRPLYAVPRPTHVVRFFA